MKMKVQLCGIDTATLPIYSSEETYKFFKQYQSGQHEVKEILIMGNLRLVLSLVQRFLHRGEQADDLLQVGVIGLIKAIENFDLSHNVRFSTYAVPMIIGELKRHLREHHPVRVSRSIRDTAYKVMRARDAFLLAHDKDPTIKELASETGLREEDILFSLDALQDPMSLNEMLQNDQGEGISMMDQLRDPSVSEDQWLTFFTIKQGLEVLTVRERSIISKRILEGQTQTEIADELGMSQAQISRIEKNALAYIKNQLNDEEVTR